ncbi:MAG: bacillithiol system redox-active protein YtxJ [Vicinamibacterales bacterium]
MPDQWTPLRTEADFARAIEESYTTPVIILKHSLSCGTSHMAFDDLQSWLAAGADTGPRYLVTVQTDRAVSTLIASRLGVRHESPQALVLRNGAVAWHGSHYRVTPDAIARALTDAAA